jgi:hypothetical protein
MNLCLPTLHGMIDRRILVNFRVAPTVLEEVLPLPFRPKLVRGWGMAGICLIRLSQIRPRGIAAHFGISSENAAHRIAVEWEQGGRRHEGVFIPRRDTSSRINVLAGGRLFPGIHHHSEFRVDERQGQFCVEMRNRADGTHIELRARCRPDLQRTSVFDTLAEASEFFRQGALGYSVGDGAGRLDGLELRSDEWRVEPLSVDYVRSSFFANETIFPPGSVEFDSALLMRDILHEWHARGALHYGDGYLLRRLWDRPTPRGEFPLPTTQEWGEGQGEGNSNKHGPPLPGPLLPPGGEGEARRCLCN